MKSFAQLLQSDPNVSPDFKQALSPRPTVYEVDADRRLENEIIAENDAACSITADLQRVRKIVEGHKSRLNVSAVNELERTCRVLCEALRPYHRSAFTLPDLLAAIHEAGYDHEYCGDFGDRAVFLNGDERFEFQVALAQAAPRYAEAILKAAIWDESSGCLRWNLDEIAREAE